MTVPAIFVRSSASTRTLRRLPEGQALDVGLVDHDLALHDGEVGHGQDHRRAEALGADHDLALLLGQARDDAVHGREHGRLLEIVARRERSGLELRDAPPLRLHVGLLHLEVRGALVELLVGEDPLAMELVRALEGDTRNLEVGLSPRKLGARAVHRLVRLRRSRRETRRIDAGQDLPLLDAGPFLDEEAHDATGDVGRDIDVALGLDLTGGGDERSEIAARDLGHLHGDLVALVVGDDAADDADRRRERL